MYKSDITIQCVKSYVAELEQLITPRLKLNEDVRVTSASNSVIFEWKDIHWSESEADIEAIMDLLDEWDDRKIPYVFIELGEEDSDIAYWDKSHANELLCVEDPCVVKRTVCLFSEL